MNRKQLEQKYLRAKYEYYILAQPTMLDIDYDRLEDKLRKLGSPVVELVDFPTVKEIKALGLDVSKIINTGDKTLTEKKIPHLVDMLSLQKIQINDEDNMPLHEVQLFLNKIKSDYIEATAKYDGSGQECVYRFVDGKHILSESNTRGDKKSGYSKMDKMVHIVPSILKNTEQFNNKTILIRGELIMDEKLWKRKFSDPNKIDNSRNFIAGLMNRIEFNVAELKMVNFVAYSLLVVDEKSGDVSHPDKSMNLLDSFGMNCEYKPLVVRAPATTNGFIELYNKFKNYRENVCPFGLDGFVVKFPENKRKLLGENNHHPKWAVAIKFPALEVSTLIKEIEWKMSKTGEIVPLAILEPVELLGTVVKRASLSNLGTMYKKKSYPGAKVSLKKSGEIIPMITGVLTPSPYEIEYDKQIEKFMKENSK